MSGRKIISLDGKWNFAYTKTSPEETDRSILNEKYEVDLPAPAYWDDCKDILKYTKFWSRECSFNPVYRKIEFPMGALKPPDASLPYIVGTGWYRKVLKIGNDLKNKYITLHVGGAMLEAYVWLNGELLIKKLSNGTPFDVYLSNAVEGENELLIAVSNMRWDRTGCSIRGYKGKSAGLNRSVSLQISDRARISDCYIHTDSDMCKLLWDIHIDRKYSEQYSISWEITDGNNTVAVGGFERCTDNVCNETETFDLIPWSDKNPKLYNIEINLMKDGNIIDTLKQKYGFRYIESNEEKIFLNKRPIFFRGLTDHAYFPETCTVTNDVSYYMRNIKELKKIGFNWTRFHTTIPPEEYLEAADKLGMLVQVETQNGFSEEDFINMLRLCRKHPSVILYCCGNEVPIDSDVECKLNKMADLCHKLVPDVMYNPMEAMLRVECLFKEKEDGYTELPVPHNAKRLDKMRQYSDVFGTAVWVYSYDALESDMKKIDEKLSIYKKPCLIHEAGIFDTYINLDLEKRYEGTRIGTDLFKAARKYIEEMGLLNNAVTYYKNSCKWMMQISKFTLEKARRCKAVAGYDFLGATDCHWHRTGYAVGMLNEFYEMKSASTVKGIQKFNGESVIISDISHKRNYFEGENFEVELFASLYGESNIENGMLVWNMSDDNGTVYVSGITKGLDIKNGELISLEKLSIKAPAVDGIGKHMTLNVNLYGNTYSLSNDWDFWVFSNPLRISSKNLKIVNELKYDDVDYIQNGGKLLLLGSKPFQSLPIGFQIASGGRVDGNTATVVYDHPLMRDFPHDGFCDWQFMPMMENGKAICFNELNIEFKPIIEIVSTYKMIRKQSAVFELKIGKGKLLVCSLNMTEQDAAVEKLYERMLEYMSSDEFEPIVEIEAEELKNLIDTDSSIDVDFTTDECFDTGGYAEIN